MRSSIVSISLFFLFTVGSYQASVGQPPKLFDNPVAAKSDPDFAVQGEYVAPNQGLQIIAEGDGAFEMVLYQGGLPGAGWDRLPPRRFDSDSDSALEFVKSKSFRRVERASPTLGGKPPKDAIILFDGTQRSLDQHWKSGARITEDGLLMQGATTIGTFTDYELHIEFRTPFQPKARGQGRGNSGVYHQGRYETQVLDSFGLEGKNNETGGIYSIRDPDLNMCFPPLQWQTYDIIFTAPRFNSEGKKTSDALLTVKLNGVVVQNETKVPNTTAAAPEKESNQPGPLFIQDHGNPVRFRNIWVVPRDVAKEALRPRIPTSERIYATSSVGDKLDDATNIGGRILVSQLGCVSCHPMENSNADIAAIQGPILDRVGGRIRFDHLVELIASPHTTKAGTRMPDLLHGMSESERSKYALAIASFLSSTGNTIDRPGDRASLKRGELLYQSIGCAMCHSPLREGLQNESTSVPLGNLTKKYTLDSLSRFLLNPHAVRSAGLMPKLVNDMKEARDVACYLLGDSIIGSGVEEFDATIYFGSWTKLPDFESLTPSKKTKSSGLDLSISGRQDNFAIQFDSYLPIDAPDTYTFRLGSDDGSRLLIDDKEVVRVDGIHPMQYKSGKVKLEAGVHRIRIEYFENAGGEELSLEMESRELGRVSISALVTANPDGKLNTEIIPSTLRPEAQWIGFGREAFQKVGCANCHSLKIDGTTLATTMKSKGLDQLQWDQGCLSNQVPEGMPDYALTRVQRQSIQGALKNLSIPLTEKQQIHRQLTTFNCVACHSRDGLGGPEANRDILFTTKTQEMGNEGRVPPPLTGVGDKLTLEYLNRVLEEGAKDRPYMLTRMPAFGVGTLKGLAAKLAAADQAEGGGNPLTAITKQEETSGLQSNGRKLVGSEGLSCVKCHVFGNKAQGIAAIDMKKMGERLREDWFHRYMREPTRYRPGTRMPLSFPEGRSVLTTVYNGNADQQIASMWNYLAAGTNMKEPVGVDANAIVLKPDERPVIYRNFIDGLGPRGIAIGYPEQCNLAWDAGNMSLSLLWKDEFIDASRHWVGRGQGFQLPLGEDLIRLEEWTPFAWLEEIKRPWPIEKGRNRGYQFLGYRLNDRGQPSFQYEFEDAQIEDAPTPVMKSEGKHGLDRKITIRAKKNGNPLIFRAAVGNVKSLADGNYLVNDRLVLSIQGIPMQLSEINGQNELRGVVPKGDIVVLTEKLRW